MGLLSWLGLKRGDRYPNLDALMRDLRTALPATRASCSATSARSSSCSARSPGPTAASPRRRDAARAPVAHRGPRPHGGRRRVRRAPGKIPDFSQGEIDLVYSELRAICDGNERKQIMRLLLRVAAVDGRLSESEHGELVRIADELGVSLAEVEAEPEAPG